MWRDLKYAWTGLWRSPVFLASAVAALGLAIGANATIFGLVDGLWLRPPAVRDAARLTWIFATTPEQARGTWSYPEYELLRDRSSSFDAVVARGGRGATLALPNGSQELALVNVVSPNFFSALGVDAAYGRTFTPDDMTALDAQPAVVLGNAFWRSHFGSDPSIVGRTIRLMRDRPIPMTVMGVLPASFRDLDAAADRDIWMPPPVWAYLENRQTFERRTDRWFRVLGMRRPGVSREAAQADVSALASQMAQAFPDTNVGRGAFVQSHFDYRVEDGGVNALVLLGLVLLVVLITCVNVANLLLARAAARTREMAIRAAIGASRGRLLRQMLTESVLLGVLGAAAGLTVALWMIRLIPVLLVAPPGFRRFAVFEADTRVLLFTFGVTLLTTMLFGAVPSWLASRTDIVSLLKGVPGAARSRLGDRVVGRALAIAQIAVSLVLLSGAGVLVRSFDALQRADIGIANRDIVSAWSPGGRGMPSEMPSAKVALERLAALPGVRHAAVAFRAPLSLSGAGFATAVFVDGVAVDRAAPPPSVKLNGVSRDYFATLGTRVIAGRVFTAADEGSGEPVAVVSLQFARHFFPSGNALGSLLHVGTPASPPHRIVGIVENVPIESVGEPPEPYLYLPYWRGAYGEATFLVQTSGDASKLAATVKATLIRADPSLEPRQVVTMRQYLEFSTRDSRATAVLAATLGGVGLLLTVLGVYGVIAYRTARRAKEIGIRVALGADGRDVLRLVFSEGAAMAAAGLALGVPAALAATHALRSMLFGIDPWDPRSFAAAAVVLLVSVLAAVAIPARRALHVAPSITLKE